MARTRCTELDVPQLLTGIQGRGFRGGWEGGTPPARASQGPGWEIGLQEAGPLTRLKGAGEGGPSHDQCPGEPGVWAQSV